MKEPVKAVNMEPSSAKEPPEERVPKRRGAPPPDGELAKDGSEKVTEPASGE